MRYLKILFLIFIILILSGCLREYESIEITSVDVMSSQQDDGSKLTITPYIQNSQNRDTGILTLKVKIREPSTNLILAEKDKEIGYIKSKSTHYSIVDLNVSGPGEYGVEVQLFEGGNIVSQKYVPVIVKPKPGPGQPADIKLIDLNLVVTKIYSDGSGAIVDVSPAIYNQGGDSKRLTIEVTASVDPYSPYTRTDDIGIIKGNDRIRGKVSFDIPRNREYTFKVNVIENGKIAVSGRVVEKIKLNELKYNTPVTFVLVEEGKPVAATAAKIPGTPKEPGFELLMVLISLFIVYSIRSMIVRKR